MKRNLRLKGSHVKSTVLQNPIACAKTVTTFVLATVVACILGLVAPSDAVAQRSDGNDRSDAHETWFNLRPYPLATWSPRAGVGAGLGLVMNNALRSGDETLLTVAPALHERVYTLSYASGGVPPHSDEDRRIVTITGRHAHTTRDWFYGFGPASSSESRTAFTLRTFQGSARLSQRLFDDHFFVQAHGRVEHYRLYDADLPSPSQNDAAGQATVDYAEEIAMLGSNAPVNGATFTSTGAVVGIDVQYDRRDKRYRTTSGWLLQGSLERWTPIGGETFSFVRTDVGAYRWLPISGEHRIAAYGHLTQLHDVDGVARLNDRLPHFVLPLLDGRSVPGFQRSRYTSRDALVFGLAYEFPITSILGLGIEGYAAGHAASVYDDISDQFELRINGSENLSAGEDTYPLRPAAALGLRIGPRFRDQTYVDVAVGRGPESFSAVRVSLVRRLNRPRPPHHETNHWRR
ncbi:BamA/TamA family outer membrane protein [Longibacter salinarum]|uniref:BamA/TamA family outer membrane protein n=1 Tax=Longibacter salinarum TaxID=1850348 RepID=UPI00117C5810|nr:BamA/TamA family outer membrane protein [Longibacter salinarum]